MQRLKGLTTGGLPTFVDYGRSFDAGINIQEDNWVHQARKAGIDVSVVGDDTWASLFEPGKWFSTSLPYPSLNVKDIDGCDDHVIKHLPALLDKASRSKGRSIVIGHFLGVDHVGHRFGIEHPEMKDKTAKMDASLRRAVDYADQVARSPDGAGDVLVLFFSDHGQTVNGDHGGASPEEVNSLFFAYSTVPFIDEADLESMGSSPQRVPTESFFGTDRLRGLSVPTFLQTDFVPTLSVLLGLPIPSGNLGSVVPFLLPSLLMGAAPDAGRVVSALQNNCAQLNDFLVAYQKETSDSLPVGDVERIMGIYKRAEEEMARVEGVDDSERIGRASSLYKEMLSEAASSLRAVWATFDQGRMLMGVFLLGSSAFALLLRTLSLEVFAGRGGTLRISLVAAACLALHGVSLFSNSYINAGRQVSHFLACTTLLVLGLASLRTGRKEAVLALVAVAAARCILEWEAYVQEKGSGGGAGAGGQSIIVGCALVQVAALVGSSWARLSSRGITWWLVWFSSWGMSCWYLFMQTRGELDEASPYIRLGLPRAVYALAFAGLAVGVFSSAFKSCCCGCHGGGGDRGMIEVVGLGVCAMLPAASLIFGAGCILSLASSIIQLRVLSTLSPSAPPFPRALSLCLLASQLFYSTGHRPTMDGIQFSAAFVGLDDVNDPASHFAAGTLTTLNSVGPFLLLLPAALEMSPASQRGGRGGAPSGVLLFYSLTAALTAVFVYLERRHLMVWAIFAPKLVWDFAILLAVDAVFILHRASAAVGDSLRHYHGLSTCADCGGSVDLKL